MRPSPRLEECKNSNRLDFILLTSHYRPHDAPFRLIREIKSVTIWFQNKRQTERKSAAGNYSSLNVPPFTHQPPSRRTSSPTLTNRSTLAASLRPSLDRVASRSELRAPAPRTPSKRLDPSATLWDNMPSSPITDPNSPPARDYVEFGKKRTLEWACAAARLAEKDGARPGIGSAVMSRPSSRTRTRERQTTKLDLEVTDDEDEIITPPGTWGECDSRWTSDPRGDGAIIAFPSSRVNEPLKKHTDEDDDEIMKAALALCGLQNRRAL